jgi:hypothetical protein
LATKRGWKPRSYTSMLVRAKTLGISSECHGLWLTISGLASMLEIHRGTVVDWIHAPKPLPAKKFKRLLYINKDELRRWVVHNPRKLAFASRAQLVMVLEREGLADWILKHKPLKRSGDIRCLDTGRTYPSMRAASEAEFVHHTSIGSAIDEDRPTCDKRFRYLGRRRTAPTGA